MDMLMWVIHNIMEDSLVILFITNKIGPGNSTSSKLKLPQICNARLFLESSLNCEFANNINYSKK